MIRIRKFEPALAARLPETHAMLLRANLTVHPAVSRVVLHGSRGLAGGYRPDSDIDLSLIVDLPAQDDPSGMEALMQAVYETTQKNWQPGVEADLALVFDTHACGLKCFDQTAWQEGFCDGGVDCFGLYKVQKGFSGFVSNAGIQVKQMYPCLRIWRRD